MKAVGERKVLYFVLPYCRVRLLVSDRNVFFSLVGCGEEKCATHTEGSELLSAYVCAKSQTAKKTFVVNQHNLQSTSFLATLHGLLDCVKTCACQQFTSSSSAQSRTVDI